MTAAEKGFLLLTATLGDPARRPLTAAQLRDLAFRVRASLPVGSDREMQEKDLLALGYSRDMAVRILGLLNDTQLLEYYLQRARRWGCVPLTRASASYPLRLRQQLGEDSPGCLWAKGDVSLLATPCVALVGSRDLKRENLLFAQEAGRQAARQGYTLISGNARGADRTAQEACLEAGGNVISVVADELRDKHQRTGVLYLSEESFDSEFSALRALSRNRVIHSLAPVTLVAQVTLGKGGTWDGSVNNLRHGWSRLCCFNDGSAGTRALTDRGAAGIGAEQLCDLSALTVNTDNFFDRV